jgi:hypothetical protein
MATRDDGTVRPVVLTAAQVMAVELGCAAAESAAEAARIGGYELVEEQRRDLSRALSEAALMLVLQVADWSAVTDEQLEGAARDLGAMVVVEVLGPPPMAH